VGVDPGAFHSRGEEVAVRISVDRERCTGHALCQAAAPDVYVLDDLGFNVTPDGEVAAELQDRARRGALSCPESAITVEE
jgi:ferredoxin